MKIDLHVHSGFSRRPSQWVLQKIGCPESFIEPLQIYRIAQKRGMSLVTITDHNTINGALEIAHLPGTFVSEEITTYFPEDGCKVHVLAFNITEKQHEDIQKIRQNIFEMIPWLNAEKIVHSVAHPLYSINDRLTLEHFEQMLLLFRNFELNGARNDRQNRILRFILSSLTPEHIYRLQEKYGLETPFRTAWQKNLTGGSDDHSGLNIARTFTELKNTEDVDGLLAGIEAGQGDVVSQPSTPRTMAHNLYGIAWQFYRSKFSLERHARKDNLLRFLDRSLQPETETDGDGLISKLYIFLNHRKQRRATDMPASLIGLIRRETDRLLYERPEIMEPDADETLSLQNREKNWFDFVNQVSSKVMAGSVNHLLDHLSGANLFSIFQTIGSAGGLYTLLAPYFVAFSQFTKDRDMNNRVLEHFFPDEHNRYIGEKGVRIAHFTDTFYDVNGVAQTLRQQVEIALKTNKKLTIITCDTGDHGDSPGIRNFAPIGVYDLPEYPDQPLFYPPFLEMLNYCYEQKFTHIQSATPGPIGLAALAISHILKIPITGTYHTAFPQYVQYLTGDATIADMTWKYMIWYYDRMDRIYVSSKSSAVELTEKGIRPEKIKRFPRGIDTEAFHPGFRNGFYEKRFRIRENVRLLYVGRVSREKNLPLLADAFRNLCRTQPDIHLVVVGDGPWMEEMKAAMADMPCTFTGYLEGQELSAAYASADFFVFPSTTDTFGNVVLEAQASGLPVIVTDQGGPCENLIPEQTGLVVRGDDGEELVRAMIRLAGNASLREQMGRAAREYAEERSFENAFIRLWEMFEESARKPEPGFRKAG